MTGSPKLSKHAEQRMQQRGITQHIVDLVYKYSDKHHLRGDGLRCIFISRKKIRRLIDEEVILPAESDQLNGLSLLVDPNSRVVVTVMPLGDEPRARRQRRNCHRSRGKRSRFTTADLR